MLSALMLACVIHQAQQIHIPVIVIMEIQSLTITLRFMFSWHDATAIVMGIMLPARPTGMGRKRSRGGLEGSTNLGDENPVCERGAENGAKFDDDANCNDTDTVGDILRAEWI